MGIHTWWNLSICSERFMISIGKSDSDQKVNQLQKISNSTCVFTVSRCLPWILRTIRTDTQGCSAGLADAKLSPFNDDYTLWYSVQFIHIDHSDSPCLFCILQYILVSLHTHTSHAPHIFAITTLSHSTISLIGDEYFHWRLELFLDVFVIVILYSWSFVDTNINWAHQGSPKWGCCNCFIVCSACRQLTLIIQVLVQAVSGFASWLKVDASQHKFKTYIQFAFRLATHLCWLVGSCDDLHWLWSSSDNRLATQHKSTQVNTSWSQAICICMECVAFLQLASQLVNPFGPLYLQVHTQVLVSETCVNLHWVRLSRD